MSLESNGAIEVPLILRRKNGAVYLPVEVPQEVLLADVAHLVCKENGNRRTLELIDSTCTRDINIFPLSRYYFNHVSVKIGFIRFYEKFYCSFARIKT